MISGVHESRWVCTLGEACSIQISGAGLQATNQLRASHPELTGVEITVENEDPNFLRYELGVLRHYTATTAEFSLDWRESPSDAWVYPSPATQRPCFDGIEGGRKRVSDTLLTKTVFDALRGAQPLSHTLF